MGPQAGGCFTTFWLFSSAALSIRVAIVRNMAASPWGGLLGDYREIVRRSGVIMCKGR